MIIRISKDKNNPYVIVNKEFVNDPLISWKAKGILLYLLSKPDDWKVYESDIICHSTDGRDSVRSAIKELIENGYIIRSRKRDEKGRLNSAEYVVYEIPSKNGFSNIGETNIGKSPTTNNNQTNNDGTKYKKDNGVFSDEKDSVNKDVVESMKTYMNDFYRRKTKRKHPFLKADQYKTVYQNIDAFARENCLDYDGITDMMITYLNSKALVTDWNINHFATEGIMMNRYYESGIR
jgi:hypothetical protein